MSVLKIQQKVTRGSSEDPCVHTHRLHIQTYVCICAATSYYILKLFDFSCIRPIIMNYYITSFSEADLTFTAMSRQPDYTYV